MLATLLSAAALAEGRTIHVPTPNPDHGWTGAIGVAMLPQNETVENAIQQLIDANIPGRIIATLTHDEITEHTAMMYATNAIESMEEKKA